MTNFSSQYGGAVALNTAIKVTGLTKAVTTDYGTFITNKSWNSSIFIVCLISVLLANIMTGIAACCTFLPFVLNMAGEGVSEAWQKRLYLGTLGVGIGTSFGFVSPFYFTPAYFCHHTGKVPQKKMVKYGIGSAIICMIILWLALCFYAPIIFDPDYKGIPVYQIGTAGTAETTTAAPPPP
ncbi:unnamed protein product [Danaus chrysippus]|uniref:(African queen) hypothetical protein n=1 Tax=Danaus chrysippus TaxID=151541 RepID=A0A8J2R6H6_9NEOP|nr:unnamed protein product [Danaus chrysippus]